MRRAGAKSKVSPANENTKAPERSGALEPVGPNAPDFTPKRSRRSWPERGARPAFLLWRDYGLFSWCEWPNTINVDSLRRLTVKLKVPDASHFDESFQKCLGLIK